MLTLSQHLFLLLIWVLSENNADVRRLLATMAPLRLNKQRQYFRNHLTDKVLKQHLRLLLKANVELATSQNDFFIIMVLLLLTSFDILRHLNSQIRQDDTNTLKALISSRVAGLGKLSAGEKMAMKPFVKRVFTIFATNASFLRVISNFRI